MRDQLPAAESANNVLEFEIMRLESEQPDITTDYLTENLLASTHPAVNWLRECINKTVANGLGTAVAAYSVACLTHLSVRTSAWSH